MTQKQILTVRLTVGDVIRLGAFPYADATVVSVYPHSTCGPRFDCVRPYVTLSESGVPLTGMEHVDFLDATSDYYQVVRKEGRP
jgi:hypothetical protein